MLTKQQAVQKMMDDIRLRGLSANTFNTYLRNVERFLDYCSRPIEDLTEVDVRKFIIHLISEEKLMPATVNNYSSAIRFFFAVALNRTMNYLQMPLLKIPQKLPEILSRNEVSELIDKSLNIKHRALLLLAYGSGLRNSEIVKLKVSDIDSSSMRVLISGGKGKKDRYAILSESTLTALREYWRIYRPKSPEGYLFPGWGNTGHITQRTVERAVETALSQTNIKKEISPHTLRHCFATHLLEDGYSLLQIKEMLGHSNIQSTTIYLHLANTTAGITSPADKFPQKLDTSPL
jgi:site-specific recombinase XerD